ncbi:MAG: PASTA domain-containing protein [Candidatus Cybelea sp.]
MSSFQVTTPKVQLGTVKPGESVEVSHTVTNITAGVRRGSFSVVTKDEGASKWYSIKGGESSFEFAPNASKVVTVVVAPPASATPKDGYRFHLVAGIEPQADVDFDNGPDVTYAVATAKRSFPWIWIVVAIAVVAIVAALVWFLFRPRGIVVPTDLSGKSVIAAAQELSSLGVPVDNIRTCGAGSVVSSSVPVGGQMLPSGSNITLHLGTCFIYNPILRLNPGILKVITLPTP